MDDVRLAQRSRHGKADGHRAEHLTTAIVAQAVNFQIRQSSQLSSQALDVHTRSPIDVRWILPAENGDRHPASASREAIAVILYDRRREH
jgi:hypothetical protein